MWYFSDGMNYTITQVKRMDVFDFYEGVQYLNNKIKRSNEVLKNKGNG